MNPHNALTLVNDHGHTPTYCEGLVMAEIALECDYSSLVQYYMTPPEVRDDTVFVARLAEAVKLSQDGPAAQGMRDSAYEWLGRELVRWVCANARKEAHDIISEASMILEEEAAA